MRIKVIAIACAASFILPLGVTANAADTMAGDSVSAKVIPITIRGDYKVQLNKTQIIYLPEAASAVVVGNPDIADISVHSSDTLFVVGRGYGETNIIVLNKEGHTMMDSNVKVTNSESHNNVRIYSGSSVVRSTYNCTPFCQPAPILGDDASFISANKTKAKEITNTYATGNSVTSGQVAASATEMNPPPEGAGRQRTN